MSQYDFGTIDPYVVDGVQLADMLNQWRSAIHSWHRGASRPSYVVPGMMWINDTGGAANWIVNVYISPTVGDLPVFTYNTTTGIITLPSTVATTAQQIVVVEQLFSASGTYTPNAKMYKCLAEGYGGGGAGGGASSATNVSAGGGGGQAGGYAYRWLTPVLVGPSQTVTIGAGGVGTSGAGPAGGDTSLGTLLVAKGGGGGAFNAGTANAFAAGGFLSVAGTGDFTSPGMGGGSNVAITSILTVSGFGGSSPFGSGGIGTFTVTSQAGTGAIGRASGGGGGASWNAVANGIGGNGTAGRLRIIEYCLP